MTIFNPKCARVDKQKCLWAASLVLFLFFPNSREETSNLQGRVSDERRHASPAFKLRHDNKTACERLSAALRGSQRLSRQPRTIISAGLPVVGFTIKTTNDSDCSMMGDYGALNTNIVYHCLHMHVPCKS